MVFFWLFTVSIVIAQPGTMDAPLPPGELPDKIPIDGGLIYLILGGLAIGIKKLVDKRKNNRFE